MLSAFVPGRLTNPLNGQGRDPLVRAALRKRWRTNALAALIAARNAQPPLEPSCPKVVTFTVHTGGTWDDDGLVAACKPLRDAVVDAGLCHSDAPGSGHQWRYAQRIDRAHRGVEITVA